MLVSRHNSELPLAIAVESTSWTKCKLYFRLKISCEALGLPEGHLQIVIPYHTVSIASVTHSVIDCDSFC